MTNDLTTFAKQVNHAQHEAMSADDTMICMGLGMDDPNRIFGTTIGLQERFGKDRVFDMPTSENAMTGIGIGAALSGRRVLMTHQRVDFFLLALDQLVNNAAKWHFMFNSTMKVPITIRLIIGRGWGQGPTHQQNLQSWFAHIPGLKIIVPGLTSHVGTLLYQAIMDNNPVIFLEHRWLHNQSCHRSHCIALNQPMDTTQLLKSGDKLTVICNSYLLVDVLAVNAYLKNQHACQLEIIEISEPSNVQWELLLSSVKKTRRCLILDIGHKHCSLSSELASYLYEHCFGMLLSPIKRLALPDYPEPTSFGLTKNYYISQNKILSAINELIELNVQPLEEGKCHDVPGTWFKGPF